MEDLVKRFGSFVAVDHVTMQVRKGEILGFLGRTGLGSRPPYACCAGC